ncbi:hypothetical protein FOZ61_000049 [Perkinsus olseni]|uniref:EF-hand domain-containing protein n=2 Tax=Perkinsus olseni TaxID=32597 RepID=A0A7J6MIV7_PEROL|nr:hypothetical protein FOZ61_000049 [Perkinsus olseni]KAF4676361.1 hypothetical protein FOL46_004962 [Perkinsus olseni]
MGQRLPLPPIEHRSKQILSHYRIRKAEMEKLWEVFTTIDRDRNGFWTLAECFILVKEQTNSTVAPLIHSLFYFADRGNDGNLSFDDFIVSFTSFCALSREEVLQFFFIVVDSDRNGYVSKSELKEFFAYRPPGVDSAPVFPLNNKRALGLFRDGHWERLHFDDFAELADTFPNITFPAFHLQELVRKKLLGLQFWENWDDERVLKMQQDAELASDKTQTDQPGRATMKDILEYSTRKITENVNPTVKKPTDGEDDGEGSTQETVTREKDEAMAKNPLLNLIRNPTCAYHVPYVTEEFRRLQEEARKLEKDKQKRQLLAELNIPEGTGMDDYSISGASEEWSPDV